MQVGGDGGAACLTLLPSLAREGADVRRREGRQGAPADITLSGLRGTHVRTYQTQETTPPALRATSPHKGRQGWLSATTKKNR